MYCSTFQSKAWEEFKLKTGYEKSYRIGDILVLQKKLPLGRTMLYSPMVSQSQLDGIQNTDNSIKKDYLAEINKIGQESRAIFYRMELNVPKANICPLLSDGFKKSFEEMQPEHNWVMNITKSEEEILAEMKQKGRYNIKIADNGGVKVSSSNTSGNELNEFYKQYSNTGRRHKIGFRGKKYFASLLDILGQRDYARVYSARAGKTALASAVIIFYEKECLYLYGGSSEEMRNLMAPYLLHWEIIKEAKKRGYEEYNFLGIAPDDNQKHAWAGITRFKKQFGGCQVDILGSYDLPIKPLEYQMFKLAERIRR